MDNIILHSLLLPYIIYFEFDVATLTHSQNSETEDLVRFPDVLFTVRLPLCIAVRLAEERSTHLSVYRKANHHIDYVFIIISCY